MQCKHTTLIAMSGAVWFTVGCSLLTLGLNLLAEGTQVLHHHTKPYPWLEGLSPYFGSLEYAAVALMALGLFIGFFKGRYVLAKTAAKGVAYIRELPEPSPFYKMYSVKSLILIGMMMGLGMSIRTFGVPSDIRGFVDVAVGAALIHGAMGYFRELWTLKPTMP